MILKYSYEIVDMGDEFVLVPVGEGAKHIHGIFKTNKEGLEIIKLLGDYSTEEKVVDTLASKYDNDVAEIAEYVNSVIEKLKKAGFLA